MVRTLGAWDLPLRPLYYRLYAQVLPILLNWMRSAGRRRTRETYGISEIDELWDHFDPAATEARFRDLLAETEAHASADFSAQLLSQIARTRGLQRQFDSAHEILDRAETLLGVDTPVARIRGLLERGRAFNSGGKPAAALPFFVQAWELATSLHDTTPGADFHAIDAAHMVAIVKRAPSHSSGT